MNKYFLSAVAVSISVTCCAQNVGIGITIPLYPLHTVSASSSTTGAFENSNAAGDALDAVNTAASGTTTGAGVYGATSQTNLSAAGVFGQNANTTGTGIIGVGNGITNKALSVGSGGAFTGSSNGVVGFASTAASGTGVIGAGNNVSPVILTAGSGGAFTGLGTGVYANATGVSGGGTNQSVYTYNTATATTVSINAYNGVQQFKVLGNGSVSTLVTDLQNRQVIMYAPEAPEDYFQDFGEGKLSAGRAHITIDPVLAKNIVINEKHPLRVFIQPEGDCRGVYVTNKTAEGFDVVELNNGSSNISFQWSLTCNRADEKLANGFVSKNADARFELLPVQPVAAEADLLPGKGRKK